MKVLSENFDSYGMPIYENEKISIPANKIIMAISDKCNDVLSKGFNKPEFRVIYDKSSKVGFIIPDNNEEYGIEWNGDFEYFDKAINYKSLVNVGDNLSLSFRDHDGDSAGEITLDTNTMKAKLDLEK